MDKAEPLIFEYRLEKWYNPTYRGNDIQKLCHPELKTKYKGLLRYITQGGTNEETC